MVLSLNRRRLAERLKNYNLQGLIKSEVVFITRFELIFLGLTGLLSGAALGCAAALFTLKLISSFTEQQIPLNVDVFSVALLFAALFAGICMLVLIFSRFMANEALHEEPMQGKMQLRKVERVHLLKFELNRDWRNLASLVLLIVFAFSMLSYGVFYGKYFSSDIFEAPDGTLPRDFDFQFEARPLPGTPLTKGEKAFYAYDTLEKIGATDEFIEKLLSEPAVKSVKAYKEINKMNVLLKESQIDDYIDAYDFRLDGNYDPFPNTRIADLNFVRRHFGYQSDDILVGAEILSYLPDVLKSLESSVLDGRIDLDKIISGEEVILRVPAYKTKNWENDALVRTPVPYTRENAINSTTFKVGDEIHLSGLLTDEWVSGLVPESRVDSFRRHDVVAKVGAIIRSTDGRLPFTANFGKPFSILTVHDALKAMKIPATYSVVDIYTRDGYSSNELSRIIANHSYMVPYMILEDWQADIKTYKVFNLMVYIFVATLLTVLALTTLAVLMSQLLAKTLLGMKNYALLRINGLSFRRLVRLWALQVCLVIVVGCLLGVPVSLLIIQYFGIRARFEILYQISYYFPMINLLYVFIGILIISAISSLPCLLYLKKHKDNILYDI